MATTDWNLQSRSNACTRCDTPFADKQTYHTLLTMTPEEGYQRQDLCLDCSQTVQREGVFSYWQAEYRVPPPPPPEPIQKDTAESLLRELIGSDDPAAEGPRYILAVMLERKRQLKHRDTLQEEGGREVLVYEHAATGETFTIADPHLRLDQLEEVQRQVAALLGGETEPAGEEPDANAEETAGDEDVDADAPRNEPPASG